MPRHPEYLRLLPLIDGQPRSRPRLPAPTYRLWWLIGSILVAALFLIGIGVMT